MKNSLLVRLAAYSIIALSFLFGAVAVHAQDAASDVAKENAFPEQIDFFRTDITLHPDATITVVETIDYDFKELERHGIYRDIRLSKVAGALRELGINDDIHVQDENGRSSYLFTIEDGNPLHIRIGDPDVLVSGKHVYKISYTAKNAIGYSDDRDEIYWNATGNEWEVPIMAAEAHVFVPGNRVAKNFVSSYCGPLGSKSPCTTELPIYDPARDVTEFVFTTREGASLYPGSGMTIAVGFEKGILASPTKWDRVLVWLDDHWFYPMPLIVIAAWFAKPYKRWLRRRKYYQKNTIVVEYDANGYTPLEAAGILRGGIGAKDLSAEIIYLATRGFLIIKKVDGIYSFEGTGKPTDGLNYADLLLLDGISGKSESELSNTFYTTAELVCSKTGETLEAAKLLELRKGKKDFRAIGSGVSIVLGLFFAVNPGIFVFFFAGWKFGYIFSVSAILIGFLSVVFSTRKAYLTDLGFEAERSLLGLKEYISVAEEERIAFHNAPAKNPEIFEKLLPYAMVLGLEKQWAKEFEGIYTVPPKWYSDANMSNFSVLAFSSSLNGFTSSTSSAMFSSPVSSSSGGSFGSSGGGSSGGGGGGGGGGSW